MISVRFVSFSGSMRGTWLSTSARTTKTASLYLFLRVSISVGSWEYLYACVYLLLQSK